MADKTYRVIGIAMVGAAGIVGWYLLKGLGLITAGGPRSWISQPKISRSGSSVTVSADVVNNGKADGYFKLQAILVTADCPYSGRSGYMRPGEDLWGQVLTCVPSKGKWAGMPVGQGWVEIKRGETKTLSTPAVELPQGTYNIFINAAVSTSPTGQPRVYQNEHYLWIVGARV